MDRRQPHVASTFKVMSLILVVVMMSGCGPVKPGRSILGMTIGSREIKASVDGGAFISSDGDTAVLSFSGGKLMVKKDTIELAGKELAKISEDSQKVEIDYTAGKLTITVDGDTVLPSDPAK